MKTIQELLRAPEDVATIRVRAFSRRDSIVIGGGVLAGLLASLALLVFLALGALVRGEGPLFPIQLMATLAFGKEIAHKAITSNVIVTGLTIHLGVSIFYALVFAYVADVLRPATTAQALVAGACYGLAIYLVMYLYIVPRLAPLVGEDLPWYAVLLGHLAYGLTLAVFWPITERLKQREERQKPIPLPVV
ncbi:MAG TPA: DUF6789 family protein [Planctomycetota bacterium]|nr:DUF6789 family protein [Planctomycetota bacterium]